MNEKCEQRAALVYSTVDPAGTGIASTIIDLLGAERIEPKGRAKSMWIAEKAVIACYEEDVIYFDFLDEEPLEAGFYVILSRHSSSAGVKSFTAHHTGNPGPSADYGGRPRELGVAYPTLATLILRYMRDRAEAYGLLGEFEVCYEATHHGPTKPSKPLVFAEIGSSAGEWRNGKAWKVVAEAVLEALDDLSRGGAGRIVAGVGGGHYARRHTRRALEEGYCYGHIIAKHSIQWLDEELLSMMLERCCEPVETIIVEKKALRKEKRDWLAEICRKRGIEVEFI